MASKLHNTEVKVEMLKSKDECDHVQFLITETSTTGRVCAPEIAEIETLSLGKIVVSLLGVAIGELKLCCSFLGLK